jgi:hypothetical protein
MTETVVPPGKDVTKKFNKIAYGVSVVLALYFLVISGDVSQAMGTLGVALIFDPFDQRIPYDKRPFYQRAWLIVHVVFVLILLIFMLRDLA